MPQPLLHTVWKSFEKCSLMIENHIEVNFFSKIRILTIILRIKMGKICKKGFLKFLVIKKL